MTDDLTLYVDDWDDEGTRYDLIGRGAHVSTYCILTVRATVLARLTADEREQLRAIPFGAPEHFVHRVIADDRNGAVGDGDADDRIGRDRLPWVA